MSRRIAPSCLVWPVIVGGLLLLLSPATAVAQSTDELEPIRFAGPVNVMPVSVPDAGRTRSVAAEAEVRVERSGLQVGEDDEGNRGWQFYAVARCYLWAGLDASGEPIQYRRNQEEQPRGFAPLRDVPIYAVAQLRMANSDEILIQQDFEFDGNNETEIGFPVIPPHQRILPGIYEIEILVYVSGQQRRVWPLVWEEGTSIEDGGQMKFERLHPRTIRPISGMSLIGVAGRDFRGNYVAMPMGGVASRQRAIREIDDLSSIQRDIRDFEARYDNLSEHERIALPLMRAQVRRIEQIADFRRDFEDDIRDLEAYEAAVQQAMSAYAERLADDVEDLVVHLWQVSRQVYWMANLCRPDFHIRTGASGPNPMNPYERMEYSVPVMRELFGIGNGRYLDAPPNAMRDQRNPENDPITGAWHDDIPPGQVDSPRQQWLDWLRDDWMPQIGDLREQYNRLFSDPDAGVEWGILPGGEQTYFAPLWGDYLSDLHDSINNLEPTGRAYANLLAEIHTPEDMQTRYPFLDDRNRRPEPRGSNAEQYFRGIRNALDRAIINFDIELAPEVEDEEEREAVEERRRDARSDAARAPWADQDIDPTRHQEFFIERDREGESGRVITRAQYDQLDPDEQQLYEPYDLHGATRGG